MRRGAEKPTGVEGFITRRITAMRERADLLTNSGASAAGECWRKAADEWESEFTAWWLEELTVAEAAPESGYSPESLREMVRDGRVNSGSGDGVRVRRCDLPRKSKRVTPPALAGVAARLGIR